MPLSNYFKGHGEEVMASMKHEYGEKKGEQVFYATANKMKMPHPRAVKKMMAMEKGSKKKRK